MAIQIPTLEPECFRQGDTVKWKIQDPDFEPGTWALHYAFVQSGDEQTVVSSDNGDGYHLVEFDPGETAAFSVGDYHYQAYFTNGTDKYTRRAGVVKVQKAFESSGGFDGRSDAKKILDAIDTLLAGKPLQDVASYSIGDRSLERMSPTELEEWREIYARRVRKEADEERVKKGLSPRGKVLLGFRGR